MEYYNLFKMVITFFIFNIKSILNMGEGMDKKIKLNWTKYFILPEEIE